MCSLAATSLAGTTRSQAAGIGTVAATRAGAANEQGRHALLK
jgi:hypothetical protein